ncbi:MAG: S8 family serine peptidase [Candidatus Zixiibacteriota bacterium]
MKRLTTGCVAAMALSFVLTTRATAGRDPLKSVPGYQPLRPVIKSADVRISPQAPPGWIVVKFRNGMSVHAGKSRLAAAAATRVRQVFRDYGLGQPEPVVAGDVAETQARRLAAEDRVKMNLPDMSLYFRHPFNDPPLAETIIRELNLLDEVETAFFEPQPSVATAPPGTVLTTADVQTTPSWELSQHQLDQAPGGVAARAAWTLTGGTGTGVRCIDVEYGWQLTHEDLSKGATAIVIGVNQWGDTDHGTAVMGEMVADRNGFGMTGIAHGGSFGGASVATLSVADAISQATAASQPGDCILIELHSPGPHYNFEWRDDQAGYVAMEYWQDNFDAMLNAYAAGVIVCEAAGNGGEDFDDPMYTSFFDTTFRNSHAIICGAGNPPVGGVDRDRSKLNFSNYGERVNLQGYGVSVYTTGYGDLYGADADEYYTGGFSGTSSASPIVTGAVMCLSGVFQGLFGTVIDADSARTLLVATGSPQQQPNLTRHIGPRPNLQAAIAPLFDPIDSIWYSQVDIPAGSPGAIPIVLSNSHPVNSIFLPFVFTGAPALMIDSLTRGARTGYFEKVQIAYDNRFNGQIAFVIHADYGGGSPSLEAGQGEVAKLWVTVDMGAIPGQVKAVDTAILGGSTWLRLVSAFDDGRPDAFSSGSVTVLPMLCSCPHHGDLNGDGFFSIIDVVSVVDIAFRGGTPATTDPGCPHATRADYNCDGVISVQDVVGAVDVAFRGGAGPCDPCQP